MYVLVQQENEPRVLCEGEGLVTNGPEMQCQRSVVSNSCLYKELEYFLETFASVFVCTNLLQPWACACDDDSFVNFVRYFHHFIYP